MAQQTVKVEGLNELIGALKKLPEKIDQKVLKSATSRAANIIARETRNNAPVGDSGNLKKAIGISRLRSPRYTAETAVRVRKGGFYWRFIEYGTKSYSIRVRRRRVMSDSAVIYGLSAEHPGIQANPFARRAYESKKHEAVRAFAKFVEQGIAKEVAKLR